MRISEIIKAGIARGETNQQILEAVHTAHPTAETKAASVAWYRSQMKKTGSGAALARLPGPKPAGYSIGRVDIHANDPGFTAWLMLGGSRIAHVIDFGRGGPLFYEWTELSPVGIAPAMQTAFYEHALALPQHQSAGDQDGQWLTVDAHMEFMINDFLLRKELRRLLKTGDLVFVSVGKIFTSKMDGKTPAEKQYWAGQQWAEGSIVLNGMAEDDAVAVLRPLQENARGT